MPRDGNWAMGLWLAGLTASAVGAQDHAATLYELVTPVADRVVLVAAGDVSIGPMGLVAASLAATLGRWEDADAHFAAACDVTARLDALPWQRSRTASGHGCWSHAAITTQRRARRAARRRWHASSG